VLITQNAFKPRFLLLCEKLSAENVRQLKDGIIPFFFSCATTIVQQESWVFSTLVGSQTVPGEPLGEV